MPLELKCSASSIVSVKHFSLVQDRDWGHASGDVSAIPAADAKKEPRPVVEKRDEAGRQSCSRIPWTQRQAWAIVWSIIEICLCEVHEYLE